MNFIALEIRSPDRGPRSRGGRGETVRVPLEVGRVGRPRPKDVSATTIPSPARHTHFSSTDPAETRDYLDGAYGWKITARRPPADGRPLTMATAEADAVAITHATAPGQLAYRVTGDDYVVIDTLYAGGLRIEHNSRVDHYGPGDTYVANHPGADFTCAAHDIKTQTITFPSALLAEAASLQPGQSVEPVRFLSYRPLAGTGRRWRAVSRLAEAVFKDPDTAAAALNLRPMGRLLAATALATFPNTATKKLGPRDNADAIPETLRLAIIHIEANADSDVTTAEIAAAAYATPRALQYAFTRHLGTTPMRYLRQIRLDAAHNDLVTAGPAHDSVTIIATRWGFANPGRFAAAYREAYGESPRTTLHYHA